MNIKTGLNSLSSYFSEDEQKPYRRYEAAITACNGHAPTLEQAHELNRASRAAWVHYSAHVTASSPENTRTLGLYHVLKKRNADAIAIMEKATETLEDDRISEWLFDIQERDEFLDIVDKEGLRTFYKEVETRYPELALGGVG